MPTNNLLGWATAPAYTESEYNMSQEYENALKRAKSLIGNNLFSEEELARTLIQIADLTSERDRLANPDVDTVKLIELLYEQLKDMTTERDRMREALQLVVGAYDSPDHKNVFRGYIEIARAALAVVDA